MLLAKVIDVDALWQTVWSTAVATVGVCVIFSLAIVGGTRSADANKANQRGAGLAWAALALAGIAGTGAAVIYGVVLLTTK